MLFSLLHLNPHARDSGAGTRNGAAVCLWRRRHLTDTPVRVLSHRNHPRQDSFIGFLSRAPSVRVESNTLFVGRRTSYTTWPHSAKKPPKRL